MNILKKQIKKLIALLGTFLLVIATGFTCVYMNKVNADADYITQIKDRLTEAGYLNTTEPIPLNASEVQKDKEYTINDNLDWMALMVLSYEDSLEGVRFLIKNNEEQDNSQNYDLTNVTINQNGYAFYGIGINEKFPFKGTLTLSFNAVGLTLDHPLFGNLDATASILKENQSFNLEMKGATSGIAQKFICSDEKDKKITDTIKGGATVKGSVGNPNGAAGGIFGEIVNNGKGKLIISSDFMNNMVSYSGITSVSGNLAGIMFGHVEGNVSIETASTQIKGVVTGNGNDSTVGKAIGKIDGKDSTVTITDITGVGTSGLKYDVSNAQTAGGLIGSVKDTTVTFSMTGTGTSNVISMNNAIGTVNDEAHVYYAGGLIGSAENSKIVLNGNDDATLTATMTVKVVETEPGKDATGGNAAGGLVGKMENTSFDSTINLNITTGSATTSAAGYYVGGLFGYMSNGTYTFSKDVTYTTNAKGQYVGGFAGYMDSIAFESKGIITATSTINGNYAGGFAGNATRTLTAGEKVDDKKFVAENITINNTTIATEDSYTGIATGGLFGKTSNQYFDIKSVTLLNKTGVLSIVNQACYSGGIFGYDEDSTIVEDKEHVYTIKGKSETIQSSNKETNLGGFAGCFKNTILKQSSSYTYGSKDFTIDISCSNRTIISATAESESKEQSVGGVIGTYSLDKKITSTLVKASIYCIGLNTPGTGCDSYSGVIIGSIVEKDDGEAEIIIDSAASQDLRVEKNSTNGYFGGIVGANDSKNLTIKNSYVSLNGRTNGDKPSAIYESKVAGGYIGIDTGNATISKCTVQINGDHVVQPITFGGVVGQIGTENKKGVVVVDSFGYINTDNRANTVLDSDKDNTSAIWGGVAGYMNEGSVLELNSDIRQNELSVSDKDVEYAYFGMVVGYQDNALVYINPTSYNSTDGYTYKLTTTENRQRDEIGNYGSVYRNGNLDTTPDANLNDKDNWVIKRAGYKVTIKEDNTPTEFATAGDIMRLSIALNTENAFTGFAKDTYTVETLLKGNYNVTNDIDISNTGIVSINKNDIEDKNKDYAFKGKLIGIGTKPTIKGSIKAFYQPNVGLFSTVDGASFENLGVDMTISYPYTATTSVSMELIGNKQNAGGIAAISKGNITVSNVNINISVSENEYPMGDENDNLVQNHDFDNHYYGGAFGKYVYSEGGTLKFENVTTNMNFELAETAHMFGGLVGYADISTLNSKDDAKLELNNINISGNLTSKFADKKQNNQQKVDKMRFAGAVAQIGDDTKGDTVTGYLKVNADGITVKGMKISDSVASSNNNRGNVADLGGFIGYRWNNVNAEIKNVSVEGTGNSFTTSNRTSGASYGGLWNSVHGYMCLGKTSITNFTATVSGTGTNKNGLLIGDGTYLYLDMGKDYNTDSKSSIDYSVSGVTINDTAAESFDEIVGHNKAYVTDATELSTLYTTDDMYGGVVSINGYNNSKYHLYSNKAITQNNGNTRYFYDLYTTLTKNNSLREMNLNNNVTISDESQMLQWTLSHYVQVDLRQFFDIAKTYESRKEIVTFTKDIDLSDVSYYPVNGRESTYNGAGKKITLHGADFDTYVRTNTENNYLRYIKRSNSENYMLHGGIFNKVIESSISGFVLSGTVTSHESGNETYSGALVAGEVVGVLEKAGQPNEYYKRATNITNITLDGISVSNTENNWDSNYGLLISKVSSGATLNIGLSTATDRGEDENLTTNGGDETKGITMKGYETANTVASSLIGKVGSKTEDGINVTFYNMNIPDKKENNHLDKSLFIYSYNYRYDNSGVIYIFYKKDYMEKNVTLGSEIADTVEFYNPALERPISDFSKDEIGYVYIQSDYMPYIYTNDKEISVNPKTGDIVEGHGTYDDPYIIESAKQLVTLFKYLQDHEGNKRYLHGWTVNEYGKNVLESENNKEVVVLQREQNKRHYNIGERIDAKGEEKEGAMSYADLVESGFPSVENLSNAYYVITKDIDLSAAEYSGLGTSEIPFTGVFIGRKTGDDSQCVIDMPASITENGEADYGFIKYAKGAVVQNLKFSLGRNADEANNIKKKTINIAQNGYGAAVMARVVGGDNQITNVTVTGSISKYNNNTSASIGSYAGVIKYGTLLIRGFKENSVKEFSIEGTRSQYMNGLVGKIQDGFIIDDTDDNETSNYKNDNGLKATDTTDTVKADNNTSYKGEDVTDSIVSRKNALQTNDKITVTKDTASGFEYTLNNAQNLMAVTIAINSGAMNYYYNKSSATAVGNQNGQNGYDYYSRCRIADYNYVGKCSESEGKKQYTSVILHDNMENYYYSADTSDSGAKDYSGGTTQSTTFYTPYIFKFFDFGNSRIMYGNSKDKGILNRQQNDANDADVWESKYILKAGNYDLSNYWFKKCFKGIGARYNNDLIYCLQGSFVGSGKDNTIIKYDMDISDSPYASLFTILYGNYTGNKNREYTFGNFTIKGHVANVTGNGVRVAAGLASYVYGTDYHVFENIGLAGDSASEMMTITSNAANDSNAKTTDYRMAAGLFASPEKYGSSSTERTVTMKGCSANYVSVTATDDCGGFIAIDRKNTNKMLFDSCEFNNSSVKSQTCAVGGFIGTTIAGTSTALPTADRCTEIRNSKVLSSTIETEEGSAGGMIGRISKREGGTESRVSTGIKISNCKIGKFDENSKRTVVSSLYSKDKNVADGYHTGGFVGDINVINTGSLYFDAPFDNCSIDGLEVNVKSSGSYAGGFLGKSYHGIYVNSANKDANNPTFSNDTTSIKDLIINKTNPEYKADAVAGIAGYGSSANIGNVSVNSMKINAKNTKDVGGIVGYTDDWNVTFSNVKVGDGEGSEINIDGGADSSSATNEINVGGFAGRFEKGGNTNHNRFIKCSLGSDKGTVILRNAKNIGGVYGVIKAPNVNKNGNYFFGVNEFNAYNVTITSRSDGEGYNPVAFAGGIVGKIEDGNSSYPFKVYDANINNLTINSVSEAEASATSNNLYGNAAGGVVGFTNRVIEVKGFSMADSKIGNDEKTIYAGGIVGQNFSNGGISLEKSDNVENKITGTIIQGSVVGGFIGFNEANISSKINNASIKNSTVVAKSKIHNTNKLVAGGIVGMLANNQSDNIDKSIFCSTVNIEKTVISAYHYQYEVKVPANCGGDDRGGYIYEEYVGGLIGRITGNNNQSNFYNITLNNALVGFMKKSDEVQNQIPTYENVTRDTDSVGLYASYLDVLQRKQSLLKEDSTFGAVYAYNRGTFVGSKEGQNSKTNIIKVNVHYDDNKYHPSFDIGANDDAVYHAVTIQDHGKVPMQNIYNLYREDYKIIYRDIQDTANKNLNTGEVIPTALKAGGENITDYYFADIERVLDANKGIIDNGYTYGADVNNSNYRLEENYGYSDTKIQTIIEKTYKNSDGYLSPFKNGQTPIPMITVTNNEYSLNTIMNTVLNTLTNNGGGTENVKDITDVDFIRMRVNNGEVTTSGENSDSDQILRYDNTTGKFSVKSSRYDTTEDNSGTFTVCKINYKYDDDNVYSIYVPVCIKELIEVQSHLRGLGGSYYKYGESISLKKDSKDTNVDRVNIEKKNSYTLYAEFSYNKIRANYESVKLNKTIYQQDSQGKDYKFDKGTRITLIDVKDGNKVYYYTVNDDNTTKINFTEFKNATDSRYETKNINAKDNNDNDIYAASGKDICIGNNYTKDDAIEQFIIIVDKTRTNPTSNLDNKIYVRALEDENKEGIYDNISYNPECYVNVTEFTGLKNYISGSEEFNKNKDKITSDNNLKDGSTDAKLTENSQISQKGTVGISGSTYIVNPSLIDNKDVNYWTFDHPQPKYLELAITLRDSNGKSLNIPAGTKVEIKLKLPQSDGTISCTYYASGSTPYVYCFKDCMDRQNADPFNINDLNKVNGYVDFDVKFDFETATDFTGVKNDTYSAKLELLGTNDAKYPKSGEKFDEVFLTPIQGINKSNLGFAVETEDMLTQGMNGYNSESSDSGLIKFKTKIDFSEFIVTKDDKKTVNAQFEDYDNKWYKYTFNIQYKDNSKKYRDFENNSKFIKIGDDFKTIEDMNEQENVTVTKTIKYSSEENTDGTYILTDGQGGIFDLPFTLYADRDSLLTSDDTITNFKVTCTVTVYDGDPDAEGANPTVIDTLSDYFVFTVARVKTDME